MATSNNDTNIFLPKYYAQFRPSYPKELIDTIVTYCKEGGASFNVCLDLGCGTGISTKPLLEHFRKVIGVDHSEMQIAQARTELPDIEFHIASADELNFIDDGSVDLVTIAAAFQWFPIWDNVYAELRRILTNKGVVAIYTYRREESSPQFAELSKLFYGPLAEYFPEPTKFNMEDGYKKIVLPFADFKRVVGMKIEQLMSAEDYIGFIKSLSFYKGYMQHNPDGDVVEKLFHRINEITGEGTVLQEYPITLLLGRNSGASQE